MQSYVGRVFQFPCMGVIAHLAFDKINPWGRLTEREVCLHMCDASDVQRGIHNAINSSRLFIQ